MTLGIAKGPGHNLGPPWSAMGNKTANLFPDEYWPQGVPICDPEKLSVPQVYAVYDHWYARQCDESIDVMFAFHDVVVRYNPLTLRKAGSTHAKPEPDPRPGQGSSSTNSDGMS